MSILISSFLCLHSGLPYPHLGSTKRATEYIDPRIAAERAANELDPVRLEQEAEYAKMVAEVEQVRKEEWARQTNWAMVDDHHHEHHHHEEQIIPIEFVDTDGQRYHIPDARVGETVMQAAQRNKVQIPGFCYGGGESVFDYGDGPQCTSCLVYIPTDKLETFPEPDWKEKQLMEGDRESNFQSRLSCQLVLTPNHAGLVIGLGNYKNEPYIY